MRSKSILATGALLTFTLIAAAAAFTYWEEITDEGTLTLYGNIDIRQADLGFRVFGKLEKMYLEEGDAVTKGQLLAELDNTPYVQNLEQNRE